MFSLELVIRQVYTALDHVSLERVLRYFDTNIARMKTRDLGGALTPRVGESTTIRVQFFGSATAADAARNVQMGQTDAVEALMARMKFELGDRLEGAVRGAFGRTSTAYQAFFPNRLKDYGAATRETMPGLVERLANAAETYKNDLAPATVAALKAYKTEWNALRPDQLEKIGETTEQQGAVAKARAAVYKQLYRNLHFICFAADGDEAIILSYFDQSVLAPRQRVRKYEADGTVAPQGTALLRQLTDHDAEITLHNSGPGDLLLGLSAQPDAAPADRAAFKTVPAGATLAIEADELGAIAATPYLVVFNPGPTDGKYEGEVEEDGK